MVIPHFHKNNCQRYYFSRQWTESKADVCFRIFAYIRKELPVASPVGDFYSRKIPRGIFPVNSNGGKSEYFVKRVVFFTG